MTLKRSLIANALMIAFSGLLFQLNGCTLLGLGIGAATDAGQPKAGVVPGWEWTTIKPGTRIVIRLTDSSEAKGTFAMFTRLTPVAYARQFAQWRLLDSSAGQLPAPGEELVLVLQSGEQIRGRLAGYDQKLTVSTRTPIAWVIPTGDSLAKPVNLDSAVQLADQSGRTIDSLELGRLIDRRDLPCLSAVSIRSDQFQWPDISFDRIAQISYPRRHGAEIGLLVGFGVDVMVLAIAAISSSGNGDWESDGGDGYVDTGSCPLVCSFNGARYVRDAEVFAGAIFRGVQRTDWDNLDSLHERDGQYRLRIINERDETEFLDELRLLVVDHPAGTRVLPSFSGELFTLRNLEGPVAATDYARSNVRDLIATNDERVWISNPFGRNPDDTSQVRDGLVVEFRKPTDAASVTLALNVQNTVWGAYLQTQFVRLFGRDAERWYDQMNASPEARERFHQVMIREGMLQIHLWDGKAWRPAGHVWEVGPALAKDVAVRLPLAGIPGAILRVRLESTAGLWMINCVQAAYVRSPAPVVTELQPVEAHDCHGIDLRKTLREADDDHYVMPTKKDLADLTFAALPKKLGFERSFILKTTGYYRIHTPAEGEPQREVVNRLLAEPRAFGQYALRMLNGYVDAALVRCDHESSP